MPTASAPPASYAKTSNTTRNAQSAAIPAVHESSIRLIDGFGGHRRARQRRGRHECAWVSDSDSLQTCSGASTISAGNPQRVRTHQSVDVPFLSRHTIPTSGSAPSRTSRPRYDDSVATGSSRLSAMGTRGSSAGEKRALRAKQASQSRRNRSGAAVCLGRDRPYDMHGVCIAGLDSGRNRGGSNDSYHGVTHSLFSALTAWPLRQGRRKARPRCRSLVACPSKVHRQVRAPRRARRRDQTSSRRT